MDKQPPLEFGLALLFQPREEMAVIRILIITIDTRFEIQTQSTCKSDTNAILYCGGTSSWAGSGVHIQSNDSLTGFPSKALLKAIAYLSSALKKNSHGDANTSPPCVSFYAACEEHIPPLIQWPVPEPIEGKKTVVQILPNLD